MRYWANIKHCVAILTEINLKSFCMFFWLEQTTKTAEGGAIHRPTTLTEDFSNVDLNNFACEVSCEVSVSVVACACAF